MQYRFIADLQAAELGLAHGLGLLQRRDDLVADSDLLPDVKAKLLALGKLEPADAATAKRLAKPTADKRRRGGKENKAR